MADSVNEIEKYLNEQYAIAQKEVEKKLKAFMKKYKQLDKQKKKDVKSGKITEEEYNQWRVNKVLYSMHWVNLLDNIAGDMLRTNRMAVDYINGKVPDLFINAFNNLQRDIPVGPVEGYSFELINKDTVAQLVKGNEIMLPPPKDIDKYKDKQWNKKNVNSAVLQGILQGESMDAIAKRVAKSTAEKNHAVALRNARTMVTAAENSGRAASIKRAERDGVILDKIWLATSDSRTRDSHASMNGERIPSEKAFSNGLMFPGDWSTNNPSEVYNCRCTLVTKFVSFDNKKFKESLETKRKEARATNEVPREVEIEQQTEPQRMLQPWQFALLNFNESERGKVELLLVRNNVFANRQEAAALSSEELKAKLEEYITNSAEVFDNGFERAYYYYIDSTGTDYLHTLSKGTKSDIDEVAHNYTRTAKSFELNDALRHNRNLTRFQEQTKDSLMRLIEDNTLNQNTIVTRFAGSHYMNDMLGVPRNELFNIIDNYDSAEVQEQLNKLIGKETNPEKSFVSTSGNPKENVFTGKDVQLKIFVEEGTNAYIPDNPSETEIIFPPGVVYEVIGFERFQKNAWDPNDMGLKITMKMKKV